MCVCIHTCFSKYNLFCPYNVTCTYPFRIVRESLSTYSSLGKTTSPAPLSFSHLPIVLCIGLGPHGFCPVQFGQLVDVMLVQLTFGWSCWWHFMGIASDVTRWDNLTTTSLILSLLQSFYPLFHNVSLTLGALGTGVLCRCIYWDGFPQLCILIGCVFL